MFGNIGRLDTQQALSGDMSELNRLAQLLVGPVRIGQGARIGPLCTSMVAPTFKKCPEITFRSMMSPDR
jgi:hypothetical protein